MFHVLNCWKRPCWFEIPPSYCIGGSIVKLTVKKKSTFTSMRGVVVIYFGFLFLLSYSFLLYLVTKFLCFVSMTSWNFVKKKLWTPCIILSHIFLSVSHKTFHFFNLFLKMKLAFFFYFCQSWPSSCVMITSSYFLLFVFKSYHEILLQVRNLARSNEKIKLGEKVSMLC